jgi:hypothetical protein
MQARGCVGSVVRVSVLDSGRTVIAGAATYLFCSIEPLMEHRWLRGCPRSDRMASLTASANRRPGQG